MTLLNAASAVHLGDTPAQAVYLGATQVWAKSSGDLTPIGEWDYLGVTFPGPSSGGAWQHHYKDDPRAQFRINFTDRLGNTFTSVDDLAPGGLLTVRRKSDGLVLQWYPVNIGEFANGFWFTTEDHVNDPYPFEPLNNGDTIELLRASAASSPSGFAYDFIGDEPGSVGDGEAKANIGQNIGGNNPGGSNFVHTLKAINPDGIDVLAAWQAQGTPTTLTVRDQAGTIVGTSQAVLWYEFPNQFGTIWIATDDADTAFVNAMWARAGERLYYDVT